MTTAVHLEYFYGDKVKMKSFIRMPRALMNEVYGNIPAEVKYLYSLMLDRVSLSMRKGWRDEDGRVYIYFTLKDAERHLDVGKNKAVNLFKRMEELDLIRRRKQGQGKPARVYVRRFVKNPKENAEGAAPDSMEGVAPEPEIAPEAEPQAEAVMEAPPFEEAAPMPEPTPEVPETLPKEIPIPVDDVKIPAPTTEEERSQSATLEGRWRKRRPPRRTASPDCWRTARSASADWATFLLSVLRTAAGFPRTRTASGSL